MLLIFSLTVLLFVTLTLPITVVSGQEQQQWLTYEDPDLGYSIQYPSDWEEEQVINYDNTSEKSFIIPFQGKGFNVEITPVEKYLDTDTLTLKTRTFQDYVRGHTADLNSDPNLEIHKNISTTIGPNHNPAVQTHFTERAKPEDPISADTYYVDTLMVNDGYVYLLRFHAPPLDVPELFPIAEKMLSSFNITR